MIQQIQSEEDDDVIGNENVGETGSDINDGSTDDELLSDTTRTAFGSTVEWKVVSVKPGGVKTANHNQYAD